MAIQRVPVQQSPIFGSSQANPDSFFPGDTPDFLPGGSFMVRPTARNASPADISPSLFGAQPPPSIEAPTIENPTAQGFSARQASAVPRGSAGTTGDPTSYGTMFDPYNPSIDTGNTGMPPGSTTADANTGDRTPGGGAHGHTNFTGSSTGQDLVNFLNTNHLDPQSAQSAIQEYAKAHGLTGNQGNPNGMQWGEWDPVRHKYYIPNYDVRQEADGTWTLHAWGAGSDSGTGNVDPNTFGHDAALDPLLFQALAQIIGLGGMSPSGADLNATLKKLIESGGATPDITRQITSARDQEAVAEEAQLADARSELAARGLLSAPGAPQGAESQAITRTQEQLAPTYAANVAGIETHALDLANSNLISAMSDATGLSESAASNLLQAVSTGTNRETGLASIGLQVLAQNQQWKEFLMTNNLNQQQLDFMIQQGNWQNVMQLIQAFIAWAQQSGSGHF